MPYKKPKERMEILRRRINTISCQLQSMIDKKHKLNKETEKLYEIAKKESKERLTHKLSSIKISHDNRMEAIEDWKKKHRARWDEVSAEFERAKEELEQEEENKPTASNSVSYPGTSNIQDDLSSEDKALQAKLDRAPSLSREESERIESRNPTRSIEDELGKKEYVKHPTPKSRRGSQHK